MKTIGPWEITWDGNCRSAKVTERKTGCTVSGTVTERRPCFGLEIAERMRDEVLRDLDHNTRRLAGVNNDTLYDFYGKPLTVVSRTAKTIAVKDTCDDKFRIPLAKFTDGVASHGRREFVWGYAARIRIRALIEAAKQGLDRTEAACVKWRQRVEDDPDGWYAD